jgi:hypothetical protein
MLTSAWELFKKDFKNGDQVIIVTEDERFDWGTLHYNDEKGDVTLSSGLRPVRTYHWNQIVFMCQDGFPVRKVFGPSPERERKYEDVPGLLRAALAEENLEALERKAYAVQGIIGLPEVELDEVSPGFARSQEEMRAETEPFESLLTRIKWGDPIRVEARHVRLYNAGNVGPQFYLNPAEEVLRMMSGDGALAHLWQLTNVFEFEIIR